MLQPEENIQIDYTLPHSVSLPTFVGKSHCRVCLAAFVEYTAMHLCCIFDLWR